MESSSRSDLIKTIERYQNSIQHVNPPESDAQRVLHYIRKLSKLPIKLGELEKTGIGKTINALRKCQGTLGDEAGLLVGKWKAIAKQAVQEEEEEQCELRKRSGADSHSDYESTGSEYRSTVRKPNKKIKLDVEKVQAEKSIKEIKLKPSKDREHSGNDRKRKYSDKDKHERKGKYVKLEPTSPSEDECASSSDEIRVKKEASRKSKTDDKHRDSDKKRKKDKQDDDKVAKKEHDKKHHKSSKHKEDKDHRRQHSGSKSSSSCTEKKRDSKSDSEKHREREKKKHSSKNTHDSDRKSSSSSSRKDDKSSSKYSSNGPSASHENYSDDDYDNSPMNQTDDDFGAALLGISQAVSPVKKKSTPKYSSSIQSSPATNSPLNSGSEFDLLPSNDVKVEPLDDLDLQVDKVKEESFKSKEEIIRERSSLRLKEISEEEALASMTTTKNQRTKVFSGLKSRFTVKLPTLFELCVRVLQDNFDGLEYTGGVPYDVLKPILEKVTVEQLYTFENYNPYLIGETDELWEYHTKRHFRHAKRQELETWRDVYLRCVEEREEKLQSLTENISQSIANSTPVRKTKLAYCDTSHVKPPRNVARSQARHGTGNITVKKSSPKGPQPSAAAVQSVKERLAQESLGAPQAVSLASPRNQLLKKKKAPLMQKSLQLLKGLKR